MMMDQDLRYAALVETVQAMCLASWLAAESAKGWKTPNDPEIRAWLLKTIGSAFRAGFDSGAIWMQRREEK